MHYTYVLIDPRNDEVFYVGKGIGKRMHDHREDAVKGIHCNPKVENKILKIVSVGLTPIEEKIFEHHDEWPALANEMFAIRFYGLENLCNISHGGDAGWWGLKHSEATKAKMASGNWLGKHLSKETRAKIAAARTGEKNHNFGKTLSKETREKLSAANAGEKHPMFGKKLRAATKAKMSASRSGEKNPMFGKKGSQHPAYGSRHSHSEETRKKISVALLGCVRKFSEEHKAHLSVANTGKRHSEETRARMSAAWARRRQAIEDSKMKEINEPTRA